MINKSFMFLHRLRSIGIFQLGSFRMQRTHVGTLYYGADNNRCNPISLNSIILVMKTRGEISGSYGGEYEDDCLLGCCAPCSVVGVYRRFRGVYCLHHQGDE
jgi:hypothetical protein